MSEIRRPMIVIRRHDGKFFEGCGYGGPGNPVPYWGKEIRKAKLFGTPEEAEPVKRRFGGCLGLVEPQENGELLAISWLGWFVRGRRAWRIIQNVQPRDFDPNDYEMNNGQL